MVGLLGYWDNWLLGDGCGSVTSPSSFLNEDTIVSSLIDGNSGLWNGDLINSLFCVVEAHKIKAIPLQSSPQDDLFLWPMSNDGVYLIKTLFTEYTPSLDMV